jgi:hypothetical protein
VFRRWRNISPSRCNDEFNGTELCNKDCKNGPTEAHCDKNTLSHTNGNISGRDISPSPKHRKESGLSLCSQASSDELDGADEIKLGLVGLIESVGTLLLPSVSTYIDTMLIISLVYVLYISSRIFTSPFIIGPFLQSLLQSSVPLNSSLHRDCFLIESTSLFIAF